MLWLKAFHIIFMVTWFAGLCYLPRLFVYHSMSDDSISCERFKIMERKLYYGIMMPGALFTIGSGLSLLHSYAWNLYGMMLWLHLKLALALILIVYHVYCGYLIKQFKNNNNKFSHVFYRWFNEFPVLVLIAMVLLVILKPFG